VQLSETDLREYAETIVYVSRTHTHLTNSQDPTRLCGVAAVLLRSKRSQCG